MSDIFKSTVSEKGQTNVDLIGTTTVQLTGADRPLFRGVWLKALSTNTGNIFVGFRTMDGNEQGYILEAGDELPELPVSSIKMLWFVADTANQSLYWLAM